MLEGNAVVCDQKSFRARLIKSIRDVRNDGEKIIPLYDVYMECLIRFLTDKFREHKIPFFYVEAPSTPKILQNNQRRSDQRVEGAGAVGGTKIVGAASFRSVDDVRVPLQTECQ